MAFSAQAGRRHGPAPSSSSSSFTPKRAAPSYLPSSSASSRAEHGLWAYRPQYFSRRSSSRLRTHDLPLEVDAIGHRSPWAFFWFCTSLVVPFAYVYISLMVLRDLCFYFPERVHQPLVRYVPFLANIATRMSASSQFVEAWCVIEALFFVVIKMRIWWLQGKDPLEASLSAAPMLDPKDRKILWDRMMECEADDPAAFLSGWFFDEPIQNISRYDVCDFLCWSMFDGRNQEHLTLAEVKELEDFIDELEYRISMQLYGPAAVAEESIPEHEVDNSTSERLQQPAAQDTSHAQTIDNDELKCTIDSSFESPTANRRLFSNHEQLYKIANTMDASTSPGRPQRYIYRYGSSIQDDDSLASSESSFGCHTMRFPQPKQMFRFSVEQTLIHEPNFFSNLFESYRQQYEQYKSMVENADFHPVQDFRNVIVDRAHQAEESAMATAASMYEAFVQPGSNIDKQLSAISRATQTQLEEVWNSVKGMKERLETAKFLSSKRESLLQQLRGNRAMLTRMREMSYAVPSKQMAALMRRITECTNALERTESRARDAFVRATGILARGTNLALFNAAPTEPRPYAKYSSDPLLGISTYPLGFHMLVLGCTEIPLRILMSNRGFERRCVGPMSYYYHPGIDFDGSNFGGDNLRKIPLVFVHGIGIGLIIYLPLIDSLLKTGRPVLLPEIPFVSGFRPWQGPNSVLSPAVVSSTMTAMLATHGFAKGTFLGHSYGTSWLSYMCKYAPSTVAALLFMDPICFCLHYSRLTKNFVYHRPDPGVSSFMVRTDLVVNWTIQRSFPWAWITLFSDEINVPCTVFLSDKDALVPAEKVEQYLRKMGAPSSNFDSVTKEFFERDDDLNVCVFRGQYHGGWIEQPAETIPVIIDACNALCNKMAKHKTR